MRKIIAILSVAVLGFSCEKVIDVPLNDADQKVVVEGQLTDLPHQSFIKLSRTGDVYTQNQFEKVSGAIVTVVDDLGATWTFLEDPLEPGTYLDTTFLTAPNRTYNLTIDNGGSIYTAHSTTNSDVAFDSLDYYLVPGSFGEDPEDSSFFVFQNYTDPANETNFYRALPYLNGERNGTEYLNDDQLFNGNNFRQPFFADQFKHGDTLDAYLYSMDEANYTYFYSLANGQGSGPFSPAPGNPVSNIEGGPLGYFGAYMTDVVQIIFP